MVGGFEPVPDRGADEGQFGARAVGELGVMPLDRASDPVGIQPRRQTQAFLSRDNATGRQVLARVGQVVAVARQQVVEAEVGAKRQLVTRQSATGGQQEGQGVDEVRQDVREGATLAQVLAHLAEVPALERAHAAVHRLGVVERRAAAEVPLVDQGHLEAALRRIPGRGGAVDAGADDEQVELGGREPTRIASHVPCILR